METGRGNRTVLIGHVNGGVGSIEATDVVGKSGVDEVNEKVEDLVKHKMIQLHLEKR